MSVNQTMTVNAATEQHDPDRLAPFPSRASQRVRRQLAYKQDTTLVFLDKVPVKREVLRDAMSIFGRDLAEHPIWHDEIAAVYDGFSDLCIPTGALAHLLRAWADHRYTVEQEAGDACIEDALDDAKAIPVRFDHLEEVFHALVEKLASRDDGMEPFLGAYEDAEYEVRTLAGITAALRAYERAVLLPRAQKEEQEQATKGA